MSRILHLVIVSVFLSFSTAWGAELSCNYVVPIQLKFLSRHVNYSKLDANLEKRTIDQFVKSLDPSKLYLTQSDVKQIKKKMVGVFKKTRDGNCSAVNMGYDLLKKRVQQTSELAKSYLNDKFKINQKAKLILDSDKRGYAKSETALRDFQKKYMQLQAANYVATGTKLEEARTKIVKNYERAVHRMNDEDQADRLAVYLDSFARALDPHSTYWSQDAYEDFRINIGLSLEGIGATLSSKDGFTVIEQLIPGGAAAKSGLLRPKDMITAVAQGEDGPFEDVIDEDLRDVVKKIRGQKGSKVRLSIIRKKGDETKKFQVTLVRDKVDLEDEAAQIHYVDRQFGDKKIKVALIDLPSFYADARPGGRSSAADVRKLLREARKHNIGAVVLDLSTNGGGSLDDAVSLAGLFFKEGNVVKQSSRNPLQGELVLADEDPVVHFSGPLVVLTSRVSASASEIVAGTLKDYHRAVIVGGDHTYGKGTVQAVEDLPQGLGALKTTIGMFFTAGGHSTQHIGVTSDIALPSAWSTDDIGEKTLDYSLPPRTIKPFLSLEAYVAAGPSAWRPIDKSIVKSLKEQSAKRVAASDEFKKIKKDIAEAKKKKGELLISEILKEKDKDPEAAEDDADAMGKDGKPKTYAQLQAERLEKYLKRADINEAVDVAADLAVLESGGNLRLTRKEVDNTPSNQVQESGKSKKN